jgi:lysophospholipase L1-like esterase
VRWISLGLLAVLFATGAILFVPSGAPGRKALHLARNMECFKRPGPPGGVAAIGDSITAGTSDPNWGMLGRNSWFNQLVCDGGARYTFNAGIPYQTTEQIAARLSALIERRPATIVILAGTNDILGDGSIDTGIATIAKMARQIDQAGIRPVIGLLPPFDRAPREVERFNARLRGLELDVIDFHTPLAGPDGRFAPGMSDDGLHPSVQAARLMAEAARPVIVRSGSGR